MSWLLGHPLQGYPGCWVTSTLIQGQTAKKMRAKFLSKKTSDGEHIPGPGDSHLLYNSYSPIHSICNISHCLDV